MWSVYAVWCQFPSRQLYRGPAHAHAQSPCITHEQLCSLIEPTRTLYTNPAFRDGHGAALPVFRIRPEVANALVEDPRAMTTRNGFNPSDIEA